MALSIYLICISFFNQKNVPWTSLSLFSFYIPLQTANPSPSSPPVCSGGVVASARSRAAVLEARQLQAIPGRIFASAGRSIEARADLRWREVVLQRYEKNGILDSLLRFPCISISPLSLLSGVPPGMGCRRRAIRAMRARLCDGCPVAANLATRLC